MSANETQVGGTHYRNYFQHWDLAHELDLGYFEGQITKYITRHRSKKGKEDVEKALHFARKLRELAVLDDRRPRHKYGTLTRFTQYAEANKLTAPEYMVIMSACSWSMVDDLNVLIDRITKLMDTCYPPLPVPEVQTLPGALDSGEPGRGYVDQARDI